MSCADGLRGALRCQFPLPILLQHGEREISAEQPRVPMPLTVDQQRDMSRRLVAWRADPDRPIACPACGKGGLSIIDRSARPYAEWYALSCPTCGLAETLHIPLAAPVQTL